jgi:large subunit ribosomal protein L10
MNRDQKAAVVDEVAAQIADADAVFAIDYRGLSVTQAVELRTRLGEADASFRVVKNRLTSRAADKAGADSLKEVLEGPTAFAFVKGDAALAAKALANFRREHQLLAFKGGTMEGEPITVEQIESIARLPGRDALRGQFVGVLASPLTGLVRGLGSMVQGLAIALGQIQERGVVGADAGEDGDQAEAGDQTSGTEQADEVEAAEEESRAAAAEEEAGEEPASASEESSAEVEASDEQQTDASDEAETEEG